MAFDSYIFDFYFDTKQLSIYYILLNNSWVGRHQSVENTQKLHLWYNQEHLPETCFEVTFS